MPVSSCAVAFDVSIVTAFISSFLGIAIPTLPFKVIHARFGIDPYNSIFRAMLPGFLLVLEMRDGLSVDHFQWQQR
ncbi:hypothetical protein AYM40_06600 [Paraburkholderia phytofirmans OLGA172]|uniref:Uncharacterized protein n=1 Tax=Paraburkholderia phytofirmans OLGA172 TaxID=1417228 RepID=A0A167VVT9_9BURK|nr:hypothetical protein AYM40_06600 [Paraburkholderia phytofirmans OLGA172]